MASASETPDTSTGKLRSNDELFPKVDLSPQHFTPPADISAQEWLVPTTTAVTPEDNPVTFTGTNDSEVDELPSSPLSFLPQHFTPPADVTAHACVVAAAMATTPDDSPETSTGTDELAVELLPSCPLLPRPQHLAPPPDVTAHE